MNAEDWRPLQVQADAIARELQAGVTRERAKELEPVYWSLKKRIDALRWAEANGKRRGRE